MSKPEYVSFKLNDKVLIILGFLLCFVVGYFVGHSYVGYGSSESQIEYVENRMGEMGQIHNFLGDDISIGHAKSMYFRYGPISRMLLAREIGNVCGPCSGEGFVLPEVNVSLREEVLDLCHALEIS